MRRHLIHFLLVAILTVCSAATAFAQTTVKGQVVDTETGDPLIGAAVTVVGTTQGSVTDVNGNFTIELKTLKAVLLFKYIGYLDVEKKINHSGVVNLGVVKMETDAVGLDEVSVIASIIRSDRQTPVPISNIKLGTIEEMLSNQEFPELLKSTPSVYVTRDSGGYGDSRINVRGFDSSNLGVLINGVPINGMENGKVYWSNWSGLSDVTQFIQVQRGLGASKLGISSVGGTMNMVTKSTESKKGGSAYVGVGNDGYRKYAVTLSTGMLDNGWAFTFSGALNTGDGYIRGTNYEGWTYFGNISKKINDSHKLSLTAFGAPQWHNQRATKHYIEDYKNSPDGGRYSNGYGYLNGALTGAGYGYNYYHKPQVSLNHYWTINANSSLTTSAYASLARGGGRRVAGNKTNWLTIDYNTGRPQAGAMLTPDGLFDYDAVLKANAESEHGSQVAFTNVVNSHDWYGLLSSYRNDLTEKITLTAGFDGRYYKGYHTEIIDNLLGGDYFLENQSASKKLYYRPANAVLKVGDKINYDNIGEIFWAGVFAQGEYNTEKWSAFLSASLTGEVYKYHNPGGAPIDGKTVSEAKTFLPWSTKAGFNYKFNENHNVFVNGGYFTRAPFMNAVFANYNILPVKGVSYEKIGTFELGYGFNNEYFNVTLNGYYTKWMDKSMSRTINNEKINITGVDAIHAGIELEATYKPCSSLDIRGMFSWGDWTWADDVHFQLYDEAQNPIGKEESAYIKNVHVGNSAQMTASLGATWEMVKGLKLNAVYNFAGKNFADFDPQNRTNPKDTGVDSWKLPNYYTIDLGLSYRFEIVKGVSATMYANVNNLTDVEYIADAKDGDKHDMKTALVFYGFGRTWSTGFRVNF